jgi:hypothetical protein
MFGAAAAAEVAAFEAANVYAVKELVETYNLDCDFQLTRAFDVYLDAGHARETEEAWRRLQHEGVVNLCDVQFVSEKDAERVSIFLSNQQSEREVLMLQQGFRRQGCALCLQFYCSTPLAGEDGASAPGQAFGNRRHTQCTSEHASDVRFRFQGRDRKVDDRDAPRCD